MSRTSDSVIGSVAWYHIYVTEDTIFHLLALNIVFISLLQTLLMSFVVDFPDVGT